MYDTITLISPEIPDSVVQEVLQFCRSFEGVDIFTGELLYSFTSGELEGSYDYRIRVKVDNSKWVREEMQTPQRIESYWHLEVECSLHKLMMAHNCWGGPDKILPAVQYLVKFLEHSMLVSLPSAEDWEVKRIDVSKIYIFKNKDICKRIVSNLRNAYYTRRKPFIYDTSIQFPGTTTTTKFYWKGPEFKVHDHKRFLKYIRREVDKSFSDEKDGDLKRHKLAMLQMSFDRVLERAMRILRFECEIKTKKLRDFFQKDEVLVRDLDDLSLHTIMNEELRKIMKEDDNMEQDVVRRSDLVLERLHIVYGSAQANSLYCTWTKLVQFGEERTKETMAKRTFYLHKKQLVEAGISWFCSIVNLKPLSIVPEDFSFTSDKYVDNSVDTEVLKALESVA